MAMATGSPGKQLFFIGDSQPNRMLNCELFHMHEVHNWTEPGAETRQVLELVRKRVQKSEIKFRNDSIGIIWVGTNDVLHNTDGDFNDNFKRLVTYVKRLFTKIILIQIPPILAQPSKTEKIQTMNKYISSFQNSDKIRILDLFQFVFKDGEILVEFFEENMGQGTRRRTDKIHLNPRALTRIGSMLESHFY